jgi:hypothetical protein
MRFVHLAPESKARAIRRSGIRGRQATLGVGPQATALRSAVYAMPVVVDVWTTFQWLRELRRGHDERMVAVYFRVRDDEIVHVGRYAQPHLEMTAAAAAAWVMKNPAGAEVVLPRRVASQEILAIRQMRQLVGWTENPNGEKKVACVCPACLGLGDRHFMRRVRAAYASGWAALRTAETDEERLSALGRLEIPLERARGRIEPKGLLALAGSRHPGIRRAVAGLFGYFRPAQVTSALERLLQDEDRAVRRDSVDSLARALGVRRTASLVSGAESDAILQFVEILEFRPLDAATVEALESFAKHPDGAVREAVSEVAQALLEDAGGAPRHRQRLEALGTVTDSGDLKRKIR